MMDSRKLALIALASLSAGCASVREKPDQMCNEIVRFANATPLGQSQSVVLITDWGSRFAENKDSIFTKDCAHGGYAPGVEFCKYLMSNTSTEFATVNYGRVTACVWPGTKGGPYDTDTEHINIKASSSEALGVNEDVEITVEFSMGSGNAAPTLKISAERNGH